MSEEFSFTAPDGGDPVDYFERTTLKLGNVGPETLAGVSLYLKDAIRVRTENGQSFQGGSFIAYNDEYLKQREKAGLSNDIVNLKFSGSMMGALSHNITSGNQIEIGFFGNAKQAEKARVNNEGGYFVLEHNKEIGGKIRVRFDAGKHSHLLKGFVVVPPRPFLGFTQEELDKAAEITAIYASTEDTSIKSDYTDTEYVGGYGYSSDKSWGGGKKKKKRASKLDY